MPQITMDWTIEFTLQFLKLYRTEPNLWDPSHKYYKRKEKLAAAWQRLAEATGKPVAELKRKKESLMATFRGHSRKKKASINEGAEGDEVYQPVWFAFNYMESFLGGVYGICAQDANQVDNEISDNADLIKPEDCDYLQPVEPTPSPNLQQSSKRRKPSVEQRETENVMTEAFTLLKSVLAREEDECDLYCKIMAKRLRKLPDWERQVLMHEMDGMVINAMNRTCYAGSTSQDSRNRRNEPDLEVDSKADIIQLGES